MFFPADLQIETFGIFDVEAVFGIAARRRERLYS